jgi:hypothetical protein
LARRVGASACVAPVSTAAATTAVALPASLLPALLPSLLALLPCVVFFFPSTGHQDVAATSPTVLAVYVIFLNSTLGMIGHVRLTPASGLPCFLAASAANPYGMAAGRAFGSELVPVGDWNGDGTPDLLVGDAGADFGGVDTGAAYVLFLRPDGLVRDAAVVAAPLALFSGAFLVNGTGFSAVEFLNESALEGPTAGMPLFLVHSMPPVSFLGFLRVGLSAPACPPGSYPHNASATCAACPPGSACAGAGGLPVVCPRGSWASGGAVACDPCPAGRFGNVSGLAGAGCSGGCTPGFACPPGSTNATAAICPVGTFSLPGAGNCSLCAAGRFGATTGLASNYCTDVCAAGTYSTPGLAACVSCIAGRCGGPPGTPVPRATHVGRGGRSL